MSKNTLKVKVGNVLIGGGAAVSVQSMTNTKTNDMDATVAQIQRLCEAGCDIVRLAVPNQPAVLAFAEIRKKTSLPMVADIHFDYRLALAAMDAGADKIRINPGNIGGKEKLQQVVKKAIACRIPVRIGVNSGSLEKKIIQEEGGTTVKGLVRSALAHVALCKEFGDVDLVVSIKSSDVVQTIQAYELFHQQSNVPLHIGLTEAGTVRTGTIKSAVALGALLSRGIGDTLRVSLTGDPVEEVVVGQQILSSLNLRTQGVNVIACPTCGRTEMDLISMAQQVEERLVHIKKPITVAVMGCEVNGPGEARHADIGVACGKNSAVLFKNGQILYKIPGDQVIEELVRQVQEMENQTE